MVKPKSKQENSASVIGAFLRSINVQLDANEADRIAHFRPTAKAVVLLEKLCTGVGSPAVLVTAPYGSGKSLTATYGLHLLENRKESSHILAVLADRFSDVNQRFGEFAKKRARSKHHAVTIALQGYVGNIRQAMCDAYVVGASRHGVIGKIASKRIHDHLATTCGVSETALFLIALSQEFEFDQLLFVWDEFGRHLESLIVNGRPSELLDVQELAEVSARSKKVPFRMCVLLHQGISSYAAAAPDNIRREWQKIEERFERVDYIDDTKELVRLLVELSETQQSINSDRPPPKQFVEHAKDFIAAGLFKEFRTTELSDLLRRAYPLDGVALFLLPRISARVAQNERTLFNFLQAADWTHRIGADLIFRFFESAMRQDVGAGGTYRALLETNSASSKCSSDEEAQTLQTACALSIGLSANRTKISRKLLLLAIAGGEITSRGAQELVDGLIERKLLLYRRHSDEVSVWHGTDANLRERVVESRIAESAKFNFIDFLRAEWPLPAIRATEHNDRCRVRRYFERQYRFANELENDALLEPLNAPEESRDGYIIHVLPVGDTKQKNAAIENARRLTKMSKGRLVITIPEEPVPLEQAALELAAIMRLQKDRALLDEDPLVAEELRQMEDDARTHLLRLVERVVTPNSKVSFVVNGELANITTLGSLRKNVSAICDRVYSKSPHLPNEQVNRKKPSAPIVNARKKLLAAILEASGHPEFGFNDPKFQKELGATVVAQYRAIIRNTGLYRPTTGSRWGFASPKSIQDKGLSGVWQLLQEFFSEPSDEPKSFVTLFATLKQPPYGVRAGVLPILIACAIRAFPLVGSMTCDGQYVADIRPTIVEEICKAPSRFALNVVAVQDDQRVYLEGVCDLFRGSRQDSIDDPDLVRRAFDWIQFWKSDAPEAVRVSNAVSKQAAATRKALWSTEDPVVVLLQHLPRALDTDVSKLPVALQRLRKVKAELDSVVDQYVKSAIQVMLSAIGEQAGEIDLNYACVRIQKWAEAIPPQVLDAVNEPRAKGVVSQLLSPGDSPAKFTNMISARLTKAVTRWDDSELSKFQQEFCGIIKVVEEAAFATAGTDRAMDSATKNRLAELVERRINHQAEMLIQILGSKQAQVRLKQIATSKNSKQEANANG